MLKMFDPDDFLERLENIIYSSVKNAIHDELQERRDLENEAGSREILEKNQSQREMWKEQENKSIGLGFESIYPN